MIKVLIIGDISQRKLDTIKLDVPSYEANSFDFRIIPSDENLYSVISEFLPSLIVTFRNPECYKILSSASLELRRRWINVHRSYSGQLLASLLIQTFSNLITTDTSLISIFTPTYNTDNKKLIRASESLCAQVYKEWEWVVYDDSTTDKTFKLLIDLTKKDYRVRIFKSHRNIGLIGSVKRSAARLCNGNILVELDHDDALTPRCLLNISEAFAAFPEAGFAYSNCSEVSEEGQCGQYEDGWAFGYGSYRQEWFNGKLYNVAIAPEINCYTIRHITSSPNHVRAWRTKTYEELGGHSQHIPVCDDYELMLRTFLKTRMIHIDHFGYIQYFDDNNTQRTRNPEIQRLVRLFRDHYNKSIHERLLELKVPDTIWTPDGYNMKAERLPGKANFVFKGI